MLKANGITEAAEIFFLFLYQTNSYRDSV